MGKIRDFFKKIRDTKGAFHAKKGTIKDRNGMDLQKQQILRMGKNTKKNYTKKSSIPDNHDGYSPRARHSGMRS